MKSLKIALVLLCLAGTVMSCTDPLDDVIVTKTDPSDAPGGNGGSNWPPKP